MAENVTFSENVLMTESGIPIPMDGVDVAQLQVDVEDLQQQVTDLIAAIVGAADFAGLQAALSGD